MTLTPHLNLLPMLYVEPYLLSLSLRLDTRCLPRITIFYFKHITVHLRRSIRDISIPSTRKMTLRHPPFAFAQYRCSYTSGLNVVIYVNLCYLVQRNLCWHCMSAAGPPPDCNCYVLWNCAGFIVIGFEETKQTEWKHQDKFLLGCDAVYCCSWYRIVQQMCLHSCT